MQVELVGFVANFISDLNTHSVKATKQAYNCTFLNNDTSKYTRAPVCIFRRFRNRALFLEFHVFGQVMNSRLLTH